MEEKIFELQSKLAQEQLTVQTAIERSAKALKTASDDEAKAKKAESDHSKIKATIQELEQSVNLLRAQRNRWERSLSQTTDMANLQEQLENERAINDQLRQDIQELQVKAQKLDQVEAQNVSLVEKYNSSKEQYRKVWLVRSQLAQKIAFTEGQVNAREVNLQALRVELNDLYSQLSKLEKDLQGKTEEHKVATNTIAERDHKIEVLTKSNELESERDTKAEVSESAS